MATPLLGSISEFDPGKEEWQQYANRLDHFFTANEITDANKKKAVFLSVLGPSTYKLLTNLIAPAEPDTKTYKQLVDELTKHHSPKPSEVVQRLQFYSRDRKPGESVSMYVAELRSIAIVCNFEGTLDKMLRDRLVGSIGNVQIRRRLLQEKDLTFAKALETALSLEAAEKNEKTLQNSEGDTDPVHKLSKPKKNKIRRKLHSHAIGAGRATIQQPIVVSRRLNVTSVDVLDTSRLPVVQNLLRQDRQSSSS